MPADGTSAAFGFSYQYLVSVVYVLRMLRADPTLMDRLVLSIEPVAVTAMGDVDDIVDFSVAVDGEDVERVQVKVSGSPEEYPLQPADARKVFARLLGAIGSGTATLLTNRPPSPGLRAEVTTLETVVAGPGERYAWEGSVEARIVVDRRSVGEIEAELEELIRGFRRDRALSQGATSCRLLGPIIRHRIFDAAAGRLPDTISGTDLVSMLSIPDPQIAHLAGGFDWGIPIANVPSLASSVPRLKILDQLTDVLALAPAARTPTIATIVGPTGGGKSIIAIDYCHINYNRYEFTCWIDSRDADLIEAQIRDALTQLTGTTIAPGTDVARPFTTALARHRGPWLLVFDGAMRREIIEKYIPTARHGAVIVTSTSSVNWWPSAHTIDVATFTTAEAIACFASYAGIAQEDIPGAARAIGDIVERLGRIPLAVSMAGVYFRNAQGELHELVADYFQTLEVLEDTLSVPPGYDRTLFAAVQHAINNLGGSAASSELQRDAKDVLYFGSFLAPELIPPNLIIPAATLEDTIDLNHLPSPAEVAKPLARAVIGLLRTQTIAQRVLHRDRDDRLGLASDTISLHPLVHEIIRSTYLRILPPGKFQGVANVLMYHLIPWLDEMRSRGDYFALEQVRVHAQALLDLIAELAPLHRSDEQNERFFTTARVVLMLELGTCFANTARYDKSTRITTEALPYLAELNEPHARRLAAVALSSTVVDLALAQTPPVVVAQLAASVLPLLGEFAQDEAEARRVLAYARAQELAQMLARTQRYRDDPRLRELANSFRQIASRNPHPDTGPHAMIDRVNELLQRGNFRDVLDDVLPRLRAAGLPPYDQLTVDAIEVVAQLGAAEFDSALLGLDRLLALELTGNHLLHPLRFGLAKILQAVNAALQINEAPADLIRYTTQLITRLKELDRDLAAAMSHE